MISEIWEYLASGKVTERNDNLLLFWQHRDTYKQENHYDTTDKQHKNKTRYLQDRQQSNGHIVVYVAVLLSKFKRYTHQRDCGVRSTETVIARGGGERYGDGEEQGLKRANFP
jgi:hypothetical protein